jgi:hypothetical protein
LRIVAWLNRQNGRVDYSPVLHLNRYRSLLLPLGIGYWAWRIAVSSISNGILQPRCGSS